MPLHWPITPCKWSWVSIHFYVWNFIVLLTPNFACLIQTTDTEFRKESVHSVSDPSSLLFILTRFKQIGSQVISFVPNISWTSHCWKLSLTLHCRGQLHTSSSSCQERKDWGSFKEQNGALWFIHKGIWSKQSFWWMSIMHMVILITPLAIRVHAVVVQVQVQVLCVDAVV